MSDCNTEELCSSGNVLYNESMYTCRENNKKISVSQQMPANTRAKELCGGTPLKVSINYTNRGDWLLETNTNTNTHAPGRSVFHTNFQVTKAKTQVGQVEQGYKADFGVINQSHVNTLYYDQALSLCEVLFTLWKFNNVHNQETHIVFITDCESGASVWAYYWEGYYPHEKFVQPCHQVPPGPLYIGKSINMYIMWSNSVNTVAREDIDPTLVFSNYKKDCFYKELYNLTYEEYMVSVIDQLIEHQDQLCLSRRPPETASKISCTNVCSNQLTDPVTSHTLLPTKIQANFGAYDDQERATTQLTDFHFPDKRRGFLLLQSGSFNFVGPDRLPITIDSVDKCIAIANIIRETGKPNYQQARIPLNSGLNIHKWEKYLADYPFQKLLQYLKFGFPLSIVNPDSITNKTITNHFSALQYPNQVTEYLKSEKAKGAILGPVDAINTKHYHCSPLLTRPTDSNKRRVILNLSYPYGASLNDAVDKTRFDGMKFNLKFPTVDDIVTEILQIKGDIYLSKIDVARAFRNLKVDPVDALKFGITWQESHYVDGAVPFGWIHGSSAFQMTSDAIAHIMQTKSYKIFAYIDDYIMVGSKAHTERAFHELTALLTELGLPMNSDKRTPPTRALTCLGIRIDVASNTLSIDGQKLHHIYKECIHVSTKTHVSKKAMQSLLGKLLYLPARAFINRILDLFRTNCRAKKIRLNDGFHKDIQWFLTFLPKFNGFTYIKREPILNCDTLHLDASVTGLGGL